MEYRKNEEGRLEVVREVREDYDLATLKYRKTDIEAIIADYQNQLVEVEQLIAKAGELGVVEPASEEVTPE